jgi:hypothetical protein
VVHQRPSQLIVATEVLASGRLTRRDLNRRYTKLYRNVYVRNGVELTALDWAYDFGRRLPVETAVIRINALLNATAATPRSVEDIARSHPGVRGTRRFRTALDLVDAGAESPQETRLRLLLVQSGRPRPVTQIPVTNERGRVVRRIDMGWPEWMVGAECDTDERSRAEYDGEQHFTNPDDYSNDIIRLEYLAAKGWAIVRVNANRLRYQRAAVVQRVRLALRQRGFPD